MTTDSPSVQGDGSAEQKPVFQVERKASLANQAGWKEFVLRRHELPERITKEKYASFTEREQLLYDRARTVAHRGVTEIRTRQMVEAHEQMQSHYTGSSGSAPIARTGVFISGIPRVGKTTIGTIYARDVERELRKEYGWGRTSTGAEFIPVVYLLVGEASGTRAFMRKALEFYGYPWKATWGVEVLTMHFVDMTHRCGTQILLLDQLQNWNMTNQGDRVVSAHLKELMDTCDLSTFGMGVDLEHTGLFSEGKRASDAQLAQIGGRFSLVHVGPMGISTDAEAIEWVTFLKTIESKLYLFDAKPGDLSDELSGYIYQRTQGVTGEVMDLVLRGANEAIERHRQMQSRSERITEELLEGIKLSQVAETASGRYKSMASFEKFTKSGGTRTKVNQVVRRRKAI